MQGVNPCQYLAVDQGQAVLVSRAADLLPEQLRGGIAQVDMGKEWAVLPLMGGLPLGVGRDQAEVRYLDVAADQQEVLRLDVQVRKVVLAVQVFQRLGGLGQQGQKPISRNAGEPLR